MLAIILLGAAIQYELMRLLLSLRYFFFRFLEVYSPIYIYLWNISRSMFSFYYYVFCYYVNKVISELY